MAYTSINPILNPDPVEYPEVLIPTKNLDPLNVVNLANVTNVEFQEKFQPIEYPHVQIPTQNLDPLIVANLANVTNVEFQEKISTHRISTCSNSN